MIMLVTTLVDNISNSFFVELSILKLYYGFSRLQALKYTFYCFCHPFISVMTVFYEEYYNMLSYISVVKICTNVIILSCCLGYRKLFGL